MNEGEVLPLCEHFRNTGIVLRFIEYMDAGTANGWRMDEVVPSSELVQKISAKWPLKPVDACYRGEVASRWAYADGAGEVGFISSVTQAFCRDCTRARLSVEGGLFLCLFADRGYDIRTMLRGGATDEEILEAVARIWTNRDNHYSEIGFAVKRSDYLRRGATSSASCASSATVLSNRALASPSKLRPFTIS